MITLQLTEDEIQSIIQTLQTERDQYASAPQIGFPLFKENTSNRFIFVGEIAERVIG